MTTTEETLVYDAMRASKDNADTLLSLVFANSTPSVREAFRDGVYVPCVKLQAALGLEAMHRGAVRHEKIERECAAYFAGKKTTEQPT